MGWCADSREIRSYGLRDRDTRHRFRSVEARNRTNGIRQGQSSPSRNLDRDPRLVISNPMGSNGAKNAHGDVICPEMMTNDDKCIHFCAVHEIGNFSNQRLMGLRQGLSAYVGVQNRSESFGSDRSRMASCEPRSPVRYGQSARRVTCRQARERGHGRQGPERDRFRGGRRPPHGWQRQSAGVPSPRRTAGRAALRFRRR